MFFLFLDLHLLPSFNPDGYEKSTIGDCDGKGSRHNYFFTKRREEYISWILNASRVEMMFVFVFRESFPYKSFTKIVAKSPDIRGKKDRRLVFEHFSHNLF